MLRRAAARIRLHGMTNASSGLHEADLTRSVIGAFFEVYRTLGFGFLEHVYCLALDRELLSRGHRVQREVAVPIFYKGSYLTSHRVDRLVDEKLVVEVKSTFQLSATAERQLRSYLGATKLELGLLLHFGPKPEFYRVLSLNSYKTFEK